METRAILASYVPGVRELEVVASTQAPHLFRKQLADSLRFPEADIRVTTHDCGGAFGLKLGIFAEDVLVCLHAMDLGRPAKWVEDRMEFFRGATQARESLHVARMGASSDGTILAYTNHYYVDLGAHNSPMGSPMLSSLMFQGPYAFQHGYVERNVVLTNKVPVGAYRGYGQPEGCFVRELLLDRIARKLRIDPLEIRRRNFIRPDQMPWQTPGGAKYDSGDYQRCMEMAAETIGYEEARERQRALRDEGRYLGIGLACYVEMTGYPGSKFLGKHGAEYGAHEGVVVRANRSGGVDVYTGVPPIGQSTETAFAQVAATVIGLDAAKVRVIAGDTQGTPVNTGSFASRTLIAGSGAIERAGREIRDKALRVAAFMLDVPVDGLELADSVISSVDDPEISVSFADVAINAFYGHRLPEGELPGLEATAYYDPISSAFSYGTAAALVEVDPETGEFSLDRFLFVHDCGRQVNPMTVEGQLHGGIAQALGAALFEELVYDGDSGQLINGSMIDYFMPTTADLPKIELDHTELPSPGDADGDPRHRRERDDPARGRGGQRALRRAGPVRGRHQPAPAHGRVRVAPGRRGQSARMKFEETFTIDHPVADAWAFFEDANRLARCVPGVESVDPGEEGRSRLRMTQKVGYMSATFDLRMHVSESKPNELLEITSIGKTVRGAAGEMRSVNRVELTDEGDRTTVRLASDVAVGGMLGSVGNKAMEAKAREVAAEFAANVNREVDAFSDSGQDAPGASAPPASPSPPPAPPSKPAGWGSQIVGLIRTIFAWLFRRTRRV